MIADEFTQENEKMNDKQEMMDDALDNIFDDDTIEEEADAVTQQVTKNIYTYMDIHIIEQKQVT